MSYFDPDIYSIDNLKDEDKNCIKEIEYVKEQVLNDTVVDEYLSEYCKGEQTTALMKEIIMPFVDNIREKMDCCMWDIIIGKIEGYTESEFEQLRQKNRKGVKK